MIIFKISLEMLPHVVYNVFFASLYYTEDMESLNQALKKRLNLPAASLPEITFREVKQHRRGHDAPTELELAFKVRNMHT